MAVRFYDEAIVNKIQKWIKDPNLRVLKPDETTRLFQTIDDDRNDRMLSLPIIALSRDRDIEIIETKKQPKTFNGIILKSNASVHIPINVIPIRISYQLDIYTRGMEEADEYVRNFVFNLINYPRFSITVPYNNCNIVHPATIELDSTISDNSDIKEKLFADEFQRFTIKFSIDDAYLFSLPINENPSVESVGLDVVDRSSKEVVESDVVYEE